MSVSTVESVCCDGVVSHPLYESPSPCGSPPDDRRPWSHRNNLMCGLKKRVQKLPCQFMSQFSDLVFYTGTLHLSMGES